MAYVLDFTVTAYWVGDGVGPMGVPSAQSLQVSNLLGGGGGLISVPGGDSPTGANFTTAAAAVGTQVGVLLNVAATLAQLQAWSTGGG